MKVEYLKDGNVVGLAAIRRKRKFPAIAQIEAYWHGLRNGRLMPTRSDIDPRGIGDHLTHSFILERIAPGHARIRLAGQSVNDVLSMEVRGMPISAFFTPRARSEFQDALEILFDMPAEVSMTLRSEAGASGAPLDAQMILLPLKDDQGRVTRVLGALQVDGDLTRGPHRFEIRSLETRPLTVSKTLAQRTRDTAVRQQTKMKRPGYWDIRGAPARDKKTHEETTKSRVDISPSRCGHDRRSEGHIMRPAGSSGIPVPGMSELAASFHGQPEAIPARSSPAVRPGGHLRLVPRD